MTIEALKMDKQMALDFLALIHDKVNAEVAKTINHETAEEWQELADLMQENFFEKHFPDEEYDGVIQWTKQ